jgi:hypothetical protein
VSPERETKIDETEDPHPDEQLCDPTFTILFDPRTDPAVRHTMTLSTKEAPASGLKIVKSVLAKSAPGAAPVEMVCQAIIESLTEVIGR